MINEYATSISIFQPVQLHNWIYCATLHENQKLAVTSLSDLNLNYFQKQIYLSSAGQDLSTFQILNIFLYKHDTLKNEEHFKLQNETCSF